MNLKKKLIKMNACDEAAKWVGDRSLRDAWAECRRADWMLWYAAQMGINRARIQFVRAEDAADACAHVSAYGAMVNAVRQFIKYEDIKGGIK